ncbi:MAG: class I SAM-dependent methyltransferase [Candidatus Levybacteria bacterium]|nr:class I SAM-dependent methyltransferase [Candidatus Levybacteria bacterium]
MDIHLGHQESSMSPKLLDIFYKVETTHWWWVGRKEIISFLLKKHLTNKKNLILDAGCGTGSNILFLKKFGDVYGVDTSLSATKFCQMRGLKNIKTADVSNLPYNDNSFDLVCLMDVLEHIKDDKKVIREIFRVLKPQGQLLITVPALPFIYSKHDKAQGHVRRYKKSDLKILFKKTGFTKVHLSYFNFLLSSPIIGIRLLSRLKLFSRLADFDAGLNFDIHKINYLNNFLSNIFSSEKYLLDKIPIPFGVSLLGLYKKTGINMKNTTPKES